MNKHQKRVRHLLAICYALQMIDPRDERIDLDRFSEAVNALGELGESLCDQLFTPLEKIANISLGLEGGSK